MGYLSTLADFMLTGQDEVVTYEDQATRAKSITEDFKQRKWFGYAEVDIEIPRPLLAMFEEMPPSFYNNEGPIESLPKHAKLLEKNRKNPQRVLQADRSAFSKKCFGVRAFT